MLPRVLEVEVMDTPEEARDYDAMDHSAVNRIFVADFLAVFSGRGPILDVGTGTAQIPIELCRQNRDVSIIAIDLAENMLQLARDNVARAHLADRIRVERCDAKQMPYPANSFAAVISNSIVHHIPEPRRVISEVVRALQSKGVVFVRDLLRPADDVAVVQLVRTYAGEANRHQQQMFEDSLRAALTLKEVQELVSQAEMNAAAVRVTSDRHWTWSDVKP